MALNPNFSQFPKVGAVVISAANVNRDGTGTMPTVYTAGDIGTKIERVRIHAQVTTTAGMVRLFLHDGASARLWDEIPVSPNTVSATVPAFKADVDYSTGDKVLWLPKGYSLRAATHNAETFNVFAVAGDNG